MMNFSEFAEVPQEKSEAYYTRQYKLKQKSKAVFEQIMAMQQQILNQYQDIQIKQTDIDDVIKQMQDQEKQHKLYLDTIQSKINSQDARKQIYQDELLEIKQELNDKMKQLAQQKTKELDDAVVQTEQQQFAPYYTTKQKLFVREQEQLKQQKNNDIDEANREKQQLQQQVADSKLILKEKHEQMKQFEDQIQKVKKEIRYYNGKIFSEKQLQQDIQNQRSASLKMLHISQKMKKQQDIFDSQLANSSFTAIQNKSGCIANSESCDMKQSIKAMFQQKNISFNESNVDQLVQIVKSNNNEQFQHIEDEHEKQDNSIHSCTTYLNNLRNNTQIDQRYIQKGDKEAIQLQNKINYCIKINNEYQQYFQSLVQQLSVVLQKADLLEIFLERQQIQLNEQQQEQLSMVLADNQQFLQLLYQFSGFNTVVNHNLIQIKQYQYKK